MQGGQGIYLHPGSAFFYYIPGKEKLGLYSLILTTSESDIPKGSHFLLTRISIEFLPLILFTFSRLVEISLYISLWRTGIRDTTHSCLLTTHLQEGARPPTLHSYAVKFQSQQQHLLWLPPRVPAFPSCAHQVCGEFIDYYKKDLELDVYVYSPAEEQNLFKFFPANHPLVHKYGHLESLRTLVSLDPLLPLSSVPSPASSLHRIPSFSSLPPRVLVTR